MTIPVHLEGMSIGIRNGGVLSFRRRKIITRAIPGNLPDYIEINIEDLDIGQSIFIKDLRVDKYSFLALDNAVVVGVRTARELIIEEEEEEELEGEEGEIIEGEEGAAAEETKATEKAEGEAGSEEKPAAE
jgi:large subunit ribosomal protein L25